MKATEASLAQEPLEMNQYNNVWICEEVRATHICHGKKLRVSLNF